MFYSNTYQFFIIVFYSHTSHQELFWKSFVEDKQTAVIETAIREHPFITYVNFSEKLTFLTP